MPPARRRLLDMRPTGGLRWLRHVPLAIAFVLSSLAVLGLIFGRHELYGETHITIDETPVPFVVACGVTIALWFIWRGRLLLTVILAPAIALCSGISFAWLLITHLLSSPRLNAGETTGIVCLFFLFWVGLVIFVVEWIVVVLERKKLEKTDPVFPTARVVNG